VKIGQVVQEEKLFKEIVDAQMHALTMDADNGPSQKLTLNTLCSGELKNIINKIIFHL